jgi:hypothetical protein
VLPSPFVELICQKFRVKHSPYMAGNPVSAIDMLDITPFLNPTGCRLPVIVRIDAEQRFPVWQFLHAAPEFFH